MDLVAKVDTGARSSSLHALDVHLLDDGRRVRFWVPLDRDQSRLQECEAALLGWRWVRDSGGHESLRPVIPLRVRMGPYTWTEEVTLAERPGMQHRMLLGRVALRGRFVVDPSRAFALGHDPRLQDARTPLASAA